jgi:hypothetical protein
MKTVVIITTALISIVPVLAFAQAPDTLWTRTYGYPDRTDNCWEAIGTPDGGLAIVGTSTQPGYLSWLYVVRINPDGDTLWTRTYADGSVGMAISSAPENGFIISGLIVTTDTYPYIIRIDSTGEEIWSHIYTDRGNSALRSIQLTGNDEFILAGFTYGDSINDILLVRIDSNGDTLWSKTYGGTEAERAWSVKNTSDGGYVVIGWTESFGNGGSDFYIIKTDQNGDSLWTRTYGDWRNEEAREIIETADGGYIFAGRRANPEIEYEYYIMKIDSQGDSLWAFADTAAQAPGIFHSLTTASTGGYALLGYTWNRIDAYKISDSGVLSWSKSFADDPVITRYSRSIIQSEDGSYFLCGHNNYDIWVVKLAPDITGIDDEIAILPNQITLHQNYPNPFNAKTTISFELAEPGDIELSLYDLLGRKVSIITNGHYGAGPHDITFDAGELTSGIYFYNLKAGEISETKSMILLK